MPTPANPELYEEAKRIVYERYTTPSAYRSGALVKKYKELGGTYISDSEPKNLRRWFKEKWVDVNPNKTSKSYPVYRPTVRVNDETPLIASEVSRSNLLEQSKLKQKIKKKKLPPFKSK